MDESGSVNESQFEARESDGETLWEVIEITAEKNKKFRVRWAGIDPKTHKPYPQSWVHRRDVTDDLVYEWRRKKALKKNRANSKSVGLSAVSRVSNSSSKPAQIDWDSPPKAGSSKPGKRRSSAEDDRPSKRQRLSSVDPRAPAARKTSKAMALEQDEDSDTPSTMASRGRQRESPVGDNDDHPPPTKAKRKPPPSVGQGRGESERSSATLKKPGKGKAKQLYFTDEDGTPSPPEVKVKALLFLPDEEEESESFSGVLKKPTKLSRPPPTPKISKTDARTSRTKSKNNPRKQADPARQNPNLDIVTESQVFRRMSPSDAERLQQFDNDVATQRMSTPPQDFRARTPVLSPAALDRLQEFDDFLLQIEAENRQFYPPSPERVSRAFYNVDTDPHPSERHDAEPVFRPNSLLRSPPPDDPHDDHPAPPSLDDPYDHSSVGSPPPPDVDAEPLRTSERGSRASTAVRSRPASPTGQDNNPPANSPPAPNVRRLRDNTIIVDETIVPETDSSHNTQSQSQGGEAKKSSPPKEDKSPPKSSPRILNGNTRMIMTTIDFADKGAGKKSKKPLLPIPRLSPRVFYPHLKSNEEPPSSSRDTIEPFSPEKAPQSPRSSWPTSLIDEDQDSSLRRLQQVKEMAEKAIKERRLREKGEPQPKKTLEEIMALSRQEARRRQQEKEQQVRADADVEDSEPRELVPATQESVDLHVGEDTRTDEDESGAKAGPRPTVQHVPMEEEETTQDMRDEMARLLEEQNRQDQMEWEAGGDGNNHPPDNDPDFAMEDLGYPPDPGDEDDKAVVVKSPTNSRSPSPTSGVGHSSQIPPTASFPPEPPSLSQIQIDSPEEVKLAYDRALVLLNEKSEEIKRLEEDLSQERSENDKLTVKIRDLGQQLVEAPPQPPSPNADTIALLQRQLEEEREARQQVTKALEAANASVAAASESVQAANTAKLSAEKDRDFFQEQYAHASAYVSTVRDENRDLEKRIGIAEGQTRDGVAMVRKTFETRMKDLERDAKMWRNMANFLMEKDKRTDDEVRRRAALEPELQVRCQKLEDAMEVKDVNIEKLENDLERAQLQNEKLEEEIEKWKTEVARLNEELRGNELVYRCEWRVNGSVCPNAFDTVEELEQHMFNAGHLTTTLS